MRNVLLVAVGGALGSVLRWGVSGVVQRWSSGPFPWGTLAVNLAGSLAIGLVGGLALERALIPPPTRLFVIVGLLGGFTTYSAFSFETLALLRDGQWTSALGYVLGSVAGGLAAAFAGHALAMRL